MSEKFTPEFIAEQLTYFQRSHKPKGFIVNGTVSSLDGEGDPYPIAVCIDSKTAMYLSEAGYNYPDALAEIARLREALQAIAHGPIGYWNEPRHAQEVIKAMMDRADAALKGQEAEGN